MKFLDNAGGNVPPLIGEKFFKKEQDKTLLEFSSLVSSAAYCGTSGRSGDRLLFMPHDPHS